MAKCLKSPSDETRTALSRGAKAKRAGVAAKPTPSALAILSSWPVKRARRARRRRRHVPRRRWADLTYALAGLIAEQALANDMSDYMSIRAVCREWRRGAVDAALRPRGCLDRRFLPRRWIMLREAAPPGPGRHRRRFLNVSTGECVQKDLPELNGHHLLGATTEGLLALLDESTYVVRILNPITQQLAELPSVDTVLSSETRQTISRYGFTNSCWVAGIGLADDTTSTVALCLRKQVHVAKPGDDRWTAVRVGLGWRNFYSAMSFSGRFYCLAGSSVMVLEVTAANNEPPRLEVVADITFSVSEICMDTVHLLESDGKLLVLRSWIGKSKGDIDDCWMRKCQVYGVDLDGHRIVPVRGLRGRAVFVGRRRAMSVFTGVFPSIRSNSIYLGYDIPERTTSDGMVAYNLHDRNITERCNRRDGGRAWTRPCGIAEYLSCYVSEPNGNMEEI